MSTFETLLNALSYQTREFLLSWIASPFTLVELLELVRLESEADANFILAELEVCGIHLNDTFSADFV